MNPSRIAVVVAALVVIAVAGFLATRKPEATQVVSTTPAAPASQPTPSTVRTDIVTKDGEEVIIMAYTSQMKHINNPAALAAFAKAMPPKLPDPGFDPTDEASQAEVKKLAEDPKSTERWLLYDQGKLVKGFDTAAAAQAESAAHSQADATARPIVVAVRKSENRIIFDMGGIPTDYLKR